MSDVLSSNKTQHELFVIYDLPCLTITCGRKVQWEHFTVLTTTLPITREEQKENYKITRLKSLNCTM